jgi:hypothetical protein
MKNERKIRSYNTYEKRNAYRILVQNSEGKKLLAVDGEKYENESK